VNDLNHKQRKAAEALRVKRPMCIPGTNAIIVLKEAHEWHADVAGVALEQDIQPDQMTAFCDVAGVAE
jgi:hypothetical protein